MKSTRARIPHLVRIHLLIVSLFAAGMASASPSSPEFSLEAQREGESKISSLIGGRDRIKLDFTSLDECATPAWKGIPFLNGPEGDHGMKGPHSVFFRSGTFIGTMELASLCCGTGTGE